MKRNEAEKITARENIAKKIKYKYKFIAGLTRKIASVFFGSYEEIAFPRTWKEKKKYKDVIIVKRSTKREVSLFIKA